MIRAVLARVPKLNVHHAAKSRSTVRAQARCASCASLGSPKAEAIPCENALNSEAASCLLLPTCAAGALKRLKASTTLAEAARFYQGRSESASNCSGLVQGYTLMEQV